MVERFIMEQKSQREWAWLLALYLFLGSLGGSLFLLFRIFQLPLLFGIVSLGLVLLGAVTLLFKLGSPQRAWRAIFRPSTSWISRGVLFVACFLLFGGLSVAPSLAPWVPAVSFLPWTEGSALASGLSWAASLFALLTMIYPGFVVSNSRAIPFWNTPILPLLFFTYAALAATGVVLLGSSSLTDGLGRIEMLASALIVINLALIAIYLRTMSRAGQSARESVRRLNQAPLNAFFWLGIVLAGLIFPLLALVWLRSAVAVAGACLLLGGILLRYCVLRAGVYHVPAVLAPAQVDFSTLTRTSADFAREYASMTANRATGR